MKKFLFALFSSCFIAVNAIASGIPTVDILGNAIKSSDLLESVRQTSNQTKQIFNQIQQIRNQVQQLTQLEQQFKAMTGNYNMGGLLNSKVNRQMRRYLPRDWFELKQLLKKAGIPTSLNDAIQKAKDARKEGEQYPADTVFGDPDQKHAKSYEEEGQRLYATMGASQAAYKLTDQRLDDIESMSDQIDSANDLKAAVDLGNRIDTENAMLMNEMIRQISILNMQQAEQREYWRNQTGADLHRSDMTIPDISK